MSAPPIPGRKSASTSEEERTMTALFTSPKEKGGGEDFGGGSYEVSREKRVRNRGRTRRYYRELLSAKELAKREREQSVMRRLLAARKRPRESGIRDKQRGKRGNVLTESACLCSEKKRKKTEKECSVLQVIAKKFISLLALMIE